MRELKAPLCVIVTRKGPLLGESLISRYPREPSESDSALSAIEWSWIQAVYESSATRACAGVPTVRVAHEELMHRPWPTLRRMLEDLSKAGVPISRNTTRIHRRAEEWLPAGSKSEKEEGLITSMLNAAIAKQPAIPGEVAGRNSGAITQHGQLDWPVLPRTKGREAYATIVTYPSTEYVYAAAVLSHSLQMFDSSREFVALVTEKIPNETREKLKKSGYKVRPVPLIPDTWYGGNYSQCQSEKKKESADYEDRKTRWGLMMSKLHLWNMLEYDKVVYFDVDAIVTGPVNVLFGMLPSARAAVDSRQVILVGRKGHSQTGFNAGVMALVPSRKLFSAMVERTQQPPPERRAGDVQFAPALCTEQALLNDMIPPARVRLLGADMLAHPHVRDWQEMQWKRRPYEKGSGWPLLFHWVGCRKPWQVGKTDIESDLAADGTLKKYHTCDGVPNVLWWRWARRVIPPDQLRWLHPPASRSKRGECGQVGGITASDGSACCPKACGVCGGEGCGDKPGGAKACCLGSISKPCFGSKAVDPPCLLRPSSATKNLLHKAEVLVADALIRDRET